MNRGLLTEISVPNWPGYRYGPREAAGSASDCLEPNFSLRQVVAENRPESLGFGSIHRVLS